MGLDVHFSWLEKYMDCFSCKHLQNSIFSYIHNHDSVSIMNNTCLFLCRRYCSNEKLFKQWAKAMKKLRSTDVRIGGNAPIIAKRFAMEGWQVLLGAKMLPSTAYKLHPFVSVAGNTSAHQQDDIHLLFEYNIGDDWGPYTAPRANRFIVHNDYSNMMLETLDDFVASLSSFQPSLVVVSGLQMLDNFPLDASIRTAKLRQLQQALESLPSTTKVHFEMASITEERLLRELLEYIIPYADSLGMNEQELVNLCSMLEFGNVTIVSDPYPRVAKALDQIRSLYSLIEADKSASHRRLSRIHVHTLAYQAILITRDSVWRNVNGAVAKASLTAHRYVCASNKVSIDNAKLIMDDSFSVSVEPGSDRMPLVKSAPVSCWSEDAVRFCVAPNLVCTAVQQTGGGGDNVSAAGLVLQL